MPTPSAPAFEPFDGPLLADPYPFFHEWLESSPVFFAEEIGYWVVSRYDDCRRVLHDYEVFTAANALSPVTPPCTGAATALREGGLRSIPTLTNVDPPAHTRTRRIAHKAFTPRRVRDMEGVIRDIVRAFLARRPYGETSDFVADISWALPAQVLFTILGVSDDELVAVKTGATNRLKFMFGKANEEEQLDIAARTAAFWMFCEELANARRAQPRDDFISDIVHTPDADGFPLSQQEASTILFGLLLAGHETTTNLLTNGCRRLLEHRPSWKALCGDPTLIPNAVEEILRFDSSVVHWRRKTTQSVVLSDVAIPADANLLVAIGAANHDPRHFADPQTFDIRRSNASDHLSFGYGPHLCLGAPLARLEARVVFEELTTAVPELEIAPDQHFEFLPIVGFRGPSRLDVKWPS